MKAVRLNLEDRQAWQKLQHVLTSLASDYMDLVAAEQTEFKFEQQILSIAFTLISAEADQVRLNEFTNSIDRYFNRLQLVGVRRVEWEFYLIGESVPVLVQGRDIAFLKAPTPLPQNALAPKSQRSLANRSSNNSSNNALARGKARISSLAQRVRGWLTDPQTLAMARTTSRISIRDPRGALIAVKDMAIARFNDTIQWVDTFPWETWTKEKAQQIKRRHQRNLVRAIIEDVLIVGVLCIAAFWLIESLSGPSFNLALLPKQHHDSSMIDVKYRCGNPAVSLKNYVCLSRNMSYNEVAQILGSEGKPIGFDRNLGSQAVVISWEGSDLSMNATFINDRLINRSYRQITASR